jgi:uncharacterized protein (TIGR00299 family) protein
MKIAYFDAFAGASGDMILGALVDAGLDPEELREGLQGLDLKGYSLKASRKSKRGIAGTDILISVEKDQPHRHLKDILTLIDSSGLEMETKEQSREIFLRLGKAEARIHNKPLEEVHFHEVGAVDSIVDIVGAVIGLRKLSIEKVTASPLRMGSGTLECAHGTLPVPPPATVELLRGIPVKPAGVEGELVTPTGAAILSTLCETFGALPPMTLQATGYGLGKKDLPIPNLLRVIIGESTAGTDEDRIQLLETNIDDMNPQFYEYLIERLFREGARDVYLTSIIMKKNRPGVMVSVLADPDRIPVLTDILFQETTTLGARLSEIRKRYLLPREVRSIRTPWGEARIKIRSTRAGQILVAPEYEDCKKLARKENRPIREIWEAVKKAGESEIAKEG